MFPCHTLCLCFHLSLHTFDFATKNYVMFSFVIFMNLLLFPLLTFTPAREIARGWETKKDYSRNFDRCLRCISKLFFLALYITKRSPNFLASPCLSSSNEELLFQVFILEVVYFK